MVRPACRFILSLATCGSCLVLDDELNVLPLSKNTRALEAVGGELSDGATKKDQELVELKESLVDREPFSALVGLAKTVDQVKIQFMAFLSIYVYGLRDFFCGGRRVGDGLPK